jgi:hypothetical protein
VGELRISSVLTSSMKFEEAWGSWTYGIHFFERFVVLVRFELEQIRCIILF